MPAALSPLSRRAAAVVCGGVAALTLAACGTTEDATGGGSTTAVESGPIDATDARGKTISLDRAPTKVVSLEWGLTEQVVSLGVMPVGVADVEGYGNWVSAADLDDSVTDVGTRSEPSVDAIGGLGPDLIVVTEDTAGTTITQLEQTAPVFVVKPNDIADPVEHMREVAEDLGEVLGREDAADDLVDRFDAALAAAKAEVADAGLDGTPVAVSDGYQEGSAVSLRMFTEGSLWGGLVESLGLTEAWPEDGDPSYGLAQTDVEGLTKLTAADTRFVYVANDTDGGDVYADALATNPVWTGLSFVESGDVDRLPDGTWAFGGPLSGVQFVERLTDALTAA